MNTDQLIAKLDELIAATRSAAIPANMRWLSAESMAAMLDMSQRQFAERLACKPGFPKPARGGASSVSVLQFPRGLPLGACWFESSRTAGVRGEFGRRGPWPHALKAGPATTC